MIHSAEAITCLARWTTKQPHTPHMQMTQQEARMPHTAVTSTRLPSHTAECHTAARAEPKLPAPDAEGVPMLVESLGQTKKWLQGTVPLTPA